MTICPVCSARFVAGNEAERQWFARHMTRSHGIQRMQRVAGWPGAADRGRDQYAA